MIEEDFKKIPGYLAEAVKEHEARTAPVAEIKAAVVPEPAQMKLL